MTNRILACRDLAIGYDVPLIAGIDLTLAAGNLLLVHGPNGAGKTTLARTLFGFVAPIQGTIDWGLLEGTPLSHRALVHAGGRLLGQGPRGFGGLSVARQHRLLPRLLGVEPGEPAPIDQARLVASLSYGQRRMAALAMLTAGPPTCVILDEPFAGLDAAMAEQVTAWIASARARGIAILLIEHRINRALAELVDDLLLLDGRCVVYSGPAAGHLPLTTSM